MASKINLPDIPKGSRLVYDSDFGDRLTYRNDSFNPFTPFASAWVVLNLEDATNGEYFDMYEATIEPAEQATVKLAEPLVGVGRRASIKYLIGVELVAIIIFVFAVGLLISTASVTDSFVRYFLYFCYLSCAAFIVFLVILSQILHFHRVRNMGYNGWWSMLMHIPFVGVGVTIACAIVPTSFRINKRLDKAGMIGLEVIVGLFIAANICFAIVVVSTPTPTPALVVEFDEPSPGFVLERSGPITADDEIRIQNEESLRKLKPKTTPYGNPQWATPTS
jgi:uncharacterized membrane protein YhaH (DUF805 family)